MKTIIKIIEVIQKVITRLNERKLRRREQRIRESRIAKLNIYTRLHSELFDFDRNIIFCGWMDTNKGRFYLFTDQVTTSTLSFTDDQFADPFTLKDKIAQSRRKHGNGQKQKNTNTRKAGTA